MKKKCIKCKKFKELSNFSKNRKAKDGKHNYCKSCVKVYNKINYYKNREKNIKYSRNYRVIHKEDLAIKKKEYAILHKKEIKDKKRKYRKKNKNKLIKYSQEYRAEYPWLQTLYDARKRTTKGHCKDYNRYGGRGVTFLMTKEDFKYLWFRDKAYNMKKPSIDREDNNGNYELSNCRYIEHKINCSKDNYLKRRK